MGTDVQDRVREAEAPMGERQDESVTQAPGPPRGRGRRDLLIVLLGLVIAALGIGAWALTERDDSYAMAEERDVVLVEASAAVEALNTLDHRDVPAGIERWRSVSTGTLADQLADVGEEEMQLLAEQQSISTGRVVDAAVLDLDAETATVLAAVEVTVVDDSEGGSDEPEVKRNRFSAQLEKVDGEWKLASLQQVAVSL